MAKMREKSSVRERSGVAGEQVLNSSQIQQLALINSKTDSLIERGEIDKLMDEGFARSIKALQNDVVVNALARQHKYNSIKLFTIKMKIAKEVDEGLGMNTKPDLSKIIAAYAVYVEDAPIIGDNEYEGKGADFDPADG